LRKQIIRIFVVVCALALSGVAQTQEPVRPMSRTEKALMAAEKNFIEAAKKGDVEFFKHTLTDDFSFVSFDGQLYNRQDMLDQFSGPGTDILPYEAKVIVLREDSGIVTYNVVFRVPPAEDQGPPPRYQHFSTVWVKQGDLWKMKFLQMTANHWGDW
jgi:hypothetical protein